MDEITPLDGRAHSPAVREAYASWLACPNECRVPPLQKQWAEQFKIDPATLWRWKQDPAFRQMVAERIRGWFLDAAPDVVKALVDGAKAGHPKLIEIFMRHVGEIWHVGVEDLVSDRNDAETLAEQLIAAVNSDFGRIAVAHFEAVQAQRRREIEAGQAERDEGRLAAMADRLSEATEEEREQREGDLPVSG